VTHQPEFEVETGGAGSSRWVAIRGELDSGTVPQLADAFAHAMEVGATELRVDLSAVSFIDSAGMRTMIFIERAAQERGVALEIVAPADEMTELLRRAGLTSRLDLTPSDRGPTSRDFAERVEFDLPSTPLAPGRARAELRDLLGSRLSEAELGIVILLTSELVTNAVIHPGTAAETTAVIHIRVTLFDDGLRIEVADGGDGFDPTSLASREMAGVVSEGGRGLFLVDNCASRWGTERRPHELEMPFVVWFELDAQAEPGDAQDVSVAS
jgi:anti-sigma B factor antagonist